MRALIHSEKVYLCQGTCYIIGSLEYIMLKRGGLTSLASFMAIKIPNRLSLSVNFECRSMYDCIENQSVDLHKLFRHGSIGLRYVGLSKNDRNVKDK